MEQLTERTAPADATAPWHAPGRALVVGVDGSRRNRAAIDWAATTALRTHRPLTLLLVLDPRDLPMPLHRPGAPGESRWDFLVRLAEEVATAYPGLEVRKELAEGPADDALLARSHDQASLVVGRRGYGTFVRLVIGSTSLAVSGRAHVPVTVVPDRWVAADHTEDPVVVGVDLVAPQPRVLRHAFAEARARGVALVVAHGRDLPPTGTDSAPDAPDAAPDAHSLAALEAVLTSYRREFPDVEVRLLHRRAHPLTVLLDEAKPAQLLVLGRRGRPRAGGFHFGSLTRAALHYAELPLCIVPE